MYYLHDVMHSIARIQITMMKSSLYVATNVHGWSKNQLIRLYSAKWKCHPPNKNQTLSVNRQTWINCWNRFPAKSTHTHKCCKRMVMAYFIAGFKFGSHDWWKKRYVGAHCKWSGGRRRLWSYREGDRARGRRRVSRDVNHLSSNILFVPCWSRISK